MKTVFVFFSEVWNEAKKICWPKRHDFLSAFLWTVGIVIFFSFFFAFVDGIIAYVVKKIVYFFA